MQLCAFVAPAARLPRVSPASVHLAFSGVLYYIGQVVMFRMEAPMKMISRFWLALFCAGMVMMPLFMAVAQAKPAGAVP